MRTFSTFARRFSLFVPLLASLALSGCAGGGGADPYSKRYTASDINPSPRILDNAIVKGTNLSGLRLENVRVKDATFFNTVAEGVFFKNVIFDNCRFINAKFDRARMENVLFKGGILTCENDANNYSKRTIFSNAQFTQLVLDGTYLENAVFEGNNSSITLRNVHSVLAATPLIVGKNMHITIANSIFQRMVIAEVTGASSLTASDSTFYHATFGASTFTTTAFFKNTTYGGPLYLEKGRTSHRRAR